MRAAPARGTLPAMGFKRKPAHTKHEVLEALEALARTLLTLLDLAAARGEERDDRPRQYATTLARWCRDEASSRELAVASRGAVIPGSFSSLPPDERSSPWGRLRLATESLVRVRSNLVEYPTHERFAVRAQLDLFAAVLVALGEAPAAAWSRADGTYVQHFTARTGHAPNATSLSRWGAPAGPVPV